MGRAGGGQEPSLGGLEKAQPIENHQQACAHVGTDRHPHRSVIKNGHDQEYRLDAQSQGDVLPQNDVGLFG